MRINVYSFYIFISVASLPNNLRDLADFTCNLQAKFMLPKVALTSCLRVPISMERKSIPGKMIVKSSHADIVHDKESTNKQMYTSSFICWEPSLDARKTL